MRRAQEVLDESLAERSRTLAAFAITVGNDGAIADLLGLNEREVRLARRTVGRTDARSVAEALLAPAPPCVSEPAGEPAPVQAPAPEVHLPHPRDEMALVPPDTEFQSPVPSPSPQAQAPPQVLRAPEPEGVPLWTPSMDSVLLWSWESGVDLQTVASELGVTVRALLMRVQALADGGMIALAAPVTDVMHAGRHRRQHEDTSATVFGPATPFSSYVPY